DGKSLAFNRGGKLCLLDLASQKVTRVLGSAARHGAFAADGKTVTLVQEDGVSIRRLDLGTGKVLVEWRFRPDPPKGPAAPPRGPWRGGFFIPEPDPFSVSSWLSQDGATLVTLETDRSAPGKVKQTLRLHDVASGKELRRWQVPAPTVLDFALSKDRK